MEVRWDLSNNTYFWEYYSFKFGRFLWIFKRLWIYLSKTIWILRITHITNWNIRSSNEIAVFKSDKGSSIVTINKNDYGKKFEEMIKALIRKGVHEASRNTNFSILENSNLLFPETLRYLNDKMRSVSNQLVSTN